jgi:RNA polymerase sigma-70 factor (ECF subfamily)
MEILKNISDEKLIALYASGNDQALDTLIGRHRNQLYAYIFCILHDHESTEDFLQDTLIKAVVTMQQGRYIDGGKFCAWLCRIAHNLIIDSRRQEKFDKITSCDDPDINILNNMKLSEGTIENRIMEHQTRMEVRQLVSHLPEEQKEVVEMRFYRDLSFKEIAEQTGVSINTSLGRMRYALINMRRIADRSGMVLTQ